MKKPQNPEEGLVILTEAILHTVDGGIRLDYTSVDLAGSGIAMLKQFQTPIPENTLLADFFESRAATVQIWATNRKDRR
jgi:hypothetical protein